MSLIKKLAGETAVYGMSSIVGRFLNVMLVPLYTNLLPKAEYGVVIDFYANSAFLMVLFSYRLESAYFRYGKEKADQERAYSTALGSLLGSSLLLTALLMIFAVPIAGWMRYGDHADYIRWFALILAFDCLAELPFARLRTEQRPYRFALLKLIGIGVNIGLNLFWIVFCPWADAQGWHWVRAVWSPDVRIGYIFLSNVLASVTVLLLLWPEIRRMRVEAFDKALWQQMLTYGLPLMVASLAGIVNETLDRAILKYLLPGSAIQNQEQVGIYGANYKLAMMISLFTQAYRYSAEPFFFRTSGQQDAKALQAAAAKWFNIVAVAGMLFILLYIDLVKYFIGKDYRSGLHVVPVLLVANVLLGLYYNFSVWYRLKDMTRVGAWIAVAGAVVTIVLNVVFAPRFGYTASAWATLACYSVMTVLVLYFGQKHYPVDYPLSLMLFYLLLGLALWQIAAHLPAAWEAVPALKWTLRTLLFGLYGVAVWLLEFRWKARMV
jgi:O-antigen/teichoic acid export membrane protein